MLATEGYGHARCVVQQMIAALSHAHSAGIVHRDFKSDNVMLVDANDSTPERVVVTDFGLALLVADSEPITSKSNRVLGTLDYMSPEQVVGRPATAASDIYALGVVIFELLTGRLPFEAETPLARALQRVTDPPLPISSILPGLDPSWSRAIERCLQLEPSDPVGLRISRPTAYSGLQVPLAMPPTSWSCKVMATW